MSIKTWERTELHRPAIAMAAFAGILTLANETYAFDSFVAKHVGFDEGNNTFLFCSPEAINTTTTPHSVATRFRRFLSDGTITNSVVSSSAATKARIQCYSSPSLTGTPELRYGSWSTDSGGDRSVATCTSAKPYGNFAECKVQSTNQYFVYRGTACGNGISSLGGVLLNGQITGKSGMEPTLVNAPQSSAKTTSFYNDTVTSADVLGTDVSVPFYSAGKMYYAFGDTWGLSGNLRHGVLADTSLISPILGGVLLEGWLGVGGSDHSADQIVPTLSDEMQCGGHTGSVPVGGFSITESGHTYRYLWLMSLRSWEYNAQTGSDCGGNLTKVNRGTIAYSMDNGPWTRLDSTVFWDPRQPFTAGAIYQPPLGPDAGYIYFYGYVYDQMCGFGCAGSPTNNAVYLMRVYARHSHVTNRAKYEYWYGGAWHKDADCGSAGCGQYLADRVIPKSGPIRDITVAHNPWLNRYVMMGLYWGQSELNHPVWQAESLTGPWEYVGNLPYHGYNPQFHDRFMTAGTLGSTMSYLISQWINTPNSFYNVGMYNLGVQRAVLPNCNGSVN